MKALATLAAALAIAAATTFVPVASGESTLRLQVANPATPGLDVDTTSVTGIVVSEPGQ